MGLQDKRILLVVDDPNLGLALELLFAQNGYEVQIARTGEEAMERIGTSRPHVLLLDARLPFRSGFEICQIVRAKQEWRAVRIILLTPRDRQGETAKALALGADACFTKPFSTKELLRTADELAGSIR
jgi:two-component system alkaline phosphatase synthesis response regulator PhoP